MLPKGNNQNDEGQNGSGVIQGREASPCEGHVGEREKGYHCFVKINGLGIALIRSFSNHLE